jgi:hypothetical protein
MTASCLTATGITFLVDRTDDTSTATNAWIVWGTGGSSTGGTATSADTGLKAAATEAYAPATLSQPSVDTNRYVATITAGTAKVIEEAMVFVGTSTATSVATNRCLIRASFGGQSLATGDAIQFTFDLQSTT